MTIALLAVSLVGATCAVAGLLGDPIQPVPFKL